MPTIPQSRKAPHDQRRKPFEGWVSPDKDVYNNSRWRKLTARMAILQPLCVYCLQKGLTVVSEETDHINPISKGGAIYEISNLQRLCTTCHRRKTKEENQLINKL